MKGAKSSHNYSQYTLILETGLRSRELIGLSWHDIDFEKRMLMVNKTLEFCHKQKFWRAGPPKTQQRYRTIPLTSRACEILRAVWKERDGRKEAPIAVPKAGVYRPPHRRKSDPCHV